MMVGSPAFSLIHFSPPIFVKYRPNSVPANNRFLLTWSSAIAYTAPVSGRLPEMLAHVLPLSALLMRYGLKSPFWWFS